MKNLEENALQNEAVEKKKIPLPWFLWISAFIAIAGTSILGAVLVGLSAFLAWFCWIVALLFTYATIHETIANRKRMFCRKCKRKFDFDNDVAYKQIGHKVKTFNYNTNSSSEHQVRSRETFKLKVDCTCPDCNLTKSFNVSHDGRVTYWDGNIKDNDPELEIEKYFRSGSSGRKSTCFLLIGWGIIATLVAAIVLFFAGPGSDPNSNSSRDPENYYGNYAGSDGAGIFTLELNEDKTYTMTYQNLYTNASETQKGRFTYKSALDMKKLDVEGGKEYTDKDALILNPYDDDRYAVVWILATGLDINNNDVFLTKAYFEIVKVQDSLKDSLNDILGVQDPADYYGTYYGIKNNGSDKDDGATLWKLTIDSNGFTLVLDDLFNTDISSGTYRYGDRETLIDLMPSAINSYEKSSGLFLNLGNNKGLVVWLVPAYNGYTLEFGEWNTPAKMTTTELSLEEYYSDGNSYAGIYKYDNNNYITLSSDGRTVSSFYLNGTYYSGYRYFYASKVYANNVLRRTVDIEGGIVVHKNGSYYLFEIDSNGLKYSGALFSYQQ